MNYTILRARMVQEQLIPRGINDPKVLNALGKIERHKFIPDNLRESAYADFPVPIGDGQTISQPYIVALMSQVLSLKGSEKVLEIGTGSGYQTAVLAELAKEVYTIERFADLAKRAELLLTELGYSNIKFMTGDGTAGWPKEDGGFQRIVITAATSSVPKPLIAQLKEGGKMLLPLGESFSQILTLLEKKNSKLEKTEICGCVFVPLVGKYA